MASASAAPAQPPAPDPVLTAECERLIGAINDVVEQVELAPESAEADDKSEREIEAGALEAAAKELETQPFTQPDLARLATGYTSVARGIAAAMVAEDVAIEADDEPGFAKAQEKATALTAEENAIIDEVNQICEKVAPAEAPASPPLGPLPPPGAAPGI